MRYFVTGITNRQGRFRIYDMTKTEYGYCLHLHGGEINCSYTAARSLKFTSDGGMATWHIPVFKHFEAELLLSMTDPEKALYLLTNR